MKTKSATNNESKQIAELKKELEELSSAFEEFRENTTKLLSEYREDIVKTKEQFDAEKIKNDFRRLKALRIFKSE